MKKIYKKVLLQLIHLYNKIFKTTAKSELDNLEFKAILDADREISELKCEFELKARAIHRELALKRSEIDIQRFLNGLNN